MRLFRPISSVRTTAVLATAVLASAAFTVPANGQAAGVGTSLTSTKVLTAQLGDSGNLLDLLLLGDEARATIDPAIASPEAYTRLTVVSAKTALLPGNPINQDQSIEAKSSGPTTRQIAPQALPALGPVVLGLSPVLSGTVNAGELTAVVDQGIAKAGLTAEVANVSAVGGLIGLGSLKSTLASAAAGDAATATRSASVANVTVLDLGALLSGLGISLPDLTVGQLTALVDSLGAATGLPLPSGTATLGSATTALQDAIDDVQATTGGVTDATAPLSGTVDAAVASLVGALLGSTVAGQLPTVGGTVTTTVGQINAIVDQLQAQLNQLLAEGIKALDNLALLRLEGVEVGVGTKAAETVDGSAAIVTGKVGKVFVGNLELPGVDLAAAAATVNAAVAGINAKVAEVLGIVDPGLGLAGVVKVSVLDQATSVTSSDGYTRSRAGITGATATITPPANLAAIVATVAAQANDVGTLLGGQAAVSALGLSSTMTSLAQVLQLGSGALSSPTRVQVASVLAASDFARAGTTTGAPGSPGAPGGPELPRTGPTDLALFGGLAAVLALAMRRWLATPTLQAARIKK